MLKTVETGWKLTRNVKIMLDSVLFVCVSNPFQHYLNILKTMQHYVDVCKHFTLWQHV